MLGAAEILGEGGANTSWNLSGDASESAVSIHGEGGPVSVNFRVKAKVNVLGYKCQNEIFRLTTQIADENGNPYTTPNWDATVPLMNFAN